MKPKAFLTNTLDHKIDAVVRESSPPKKKQNPLVLIVFMINVVPVSA